MTVQDYLRVGRERWKIIALAMRLGLIGALAAFLVRPAEYTAQVSFYVSARVGDTPQQAYQGAQLSEQGVKSYNELVTGDRVLSETIRELSLDRTPTEFAPHVTATSALDSVIINIAVTEESPEQAAAIAKTVGTVVMTVVDDLERPAAPNGTPPVAVRIVQPASVPSEPSSTGLPVTVALGLLAGLAVGVGAAFLRNAQDTSIKSVEALSAAAGAPNLGTITYDLKAPDRPLTVHDDPQSPRADASRQLRTNPQFVDVDNPRKIILVTSPLPGEGKTITVANLAVALAGMDRLVLVIEADMRRPRLSELLGLDRSVGLSQVLAGQLPLPQAIAPWGGETFDVLSSGRIPPNPSGLLGSNQMLSLLDEVRATCDAVLTDSPPSSRSRMPQQSHQPRMECPRMQVPANHSSTTADRVSDHGPRVRRKLGTVLTMASDSGPFAKSTYNGYYTHDLPAPDATGGTKEQHERRIPVRMTAADKRCCTGMGETGNPADQLAQGS